MKTLIHTGMLALLTQFSSCQEIPRKAYKITTEVVDEAGKPVQNAMVQSSKYELIPGSPIPQSKSVLVSALTDRNGIALMDLVSVQTPGGVAIKKDGSYLTTAMTDWQHPDGFDGAWNANIKAILKSIKNPIPMLARKDLRIRTPEFDIPYGFDLELGESLPPFGNGKTSDLTLTLRGSRTSAADLTKEEIDFSVEIKCHNPGDGFVEFIVEDIAEFSRGSQLASAHEAPEDGYVQSFSRAMATDADGGLGGATNVRHADAGKCYYFRVRTKRDTQGNVVSANYGKLYGPLEIRPALARYGHDISKGQGGFFIQYLYFNPTPNDQNVEFDPKRNLVPGGNVQQP